MTRDTTRSFNRVRLPKGTRVLPCPPMRIQQIRSAQFVRHPPSLKPVWSQCSTWNTTFLKSKYRECAARTRKRQAVGVDGHRPQIALRDGLELMNAPL